MNAPGDCWRPLVPALNLMIFSLFSLLFYGSIFNKIYGKEGNSKSYITEIQLLLGRTRLSSRSLRGETYIQSYLNIWVEIDKVGS